MEIIRFSVEFTFAVFGGTRTMWPRGSSSVTLFSVLLATVGNPSVKKKKTSDVSETLARGNRIARTHFCAGKLNCSAVRLITRNIIIINYDYLILFFVLKKINTLYILIIPLFFFWLNNSV